MSRLTVWRLLCADYTASAFSGEGARLYGGRWSPRGLAAVYCSESRSLAMLEVLAHVDDPIRLSGRSWVYLSATFAEADLEKPARVPNSWRDYPYGPETQAFGAQWVTESRSLALRLPSALVPGEFNYLLNPAHPAFAKLTLGKPEPVPFDARLKS